ncbi:MAG: glycosyltransferase family 10 [Bacilli bacterium]|nr:glycosyltransferase family 10 [Bacilli bacterium]MDD3304944.1 glycosyltransferase family 10 [Bacilli bacterium]MDD4053957.1 glycosyltransferase family 10 [Bacilli bacterium]MDD4411423.1 glycosyltransferase family 10 [Bacilli bacterium]
MKKKLKFLDIPKDNGEHNIFLFNKQNKKRWTTLLKRKFTKKQNSKDMCFDNINQTKIVIDSYKQTRRSLYVSFFAQVEKKYKAKFEAQNNGKPIDLLKYKRRNSEIEAFFDYTFAVEINSFHDKICIYLVVNDQRKKLAFQMNPEQKNNFKAINLKGKKFVKAYNFDVFFYSDQSSKYKKILFMLTHDPKKFFQKLYNWSLKRMKLIKQVMKLLLIRLNQLLTYDEVTIDVNNIKKVSYVPYIGTPLNNEIFSKKFSNNWTYKLKNLLEKSGREIGTNDVINVRDADAVIFFDNMFYKNLPLLWDLYYYRKLHSTIYIDYEPPTGHCKNHSNKGIRNLSNIFKNVITYNDDLVDNKKIIKGCVADFWSNGLKYKNNFDEKKLIGMITNNTSQEQIIKILNYYNNTDYFNKKNTKQHPNQIYTKREEAARYFLNKCPEDFDLYGTFWSEEYARVSKHFIARNKKIETINKYKFLLSYDSMINQNGYISEKIFDVFRAKTVPIYWGADNVLDYIPKECFIDKRDFETYDELYNYLISMTEEEYNSRIKAIEEYLESDRFKILFSSQGTANIIYNALLNDKVKFSYEKAYKTLCKLQRRKDIIDKKDIKDAILVYFERTKNILYMTLIYSTSNNDENMDFVVKNRDTHFEIEDIQRKYDEDSKIFQYKVNLSLKDFDVLSKISVYLRFNNKLTKLRLKEYEKDNLAQLGLKIKRNKFSIVKKI